MTTETSLMSTTTELGKLPRVLRSLQFPVISPFIAVARLRGDARVSLKLLVDKFPEAPRLVESDVHSPKFEVEDRSGRGGSQPGSPLLFRLPQKLADVRVHLDNFVVLAADRAHDCIFHSSGQQAVEQEPQDAKLWREQLAGPRPAAFDEALEVVAFLQHRVHRMRLNQRRIQLIVAEAPPDPHGPRVLQKRPDEREVEVVARHDRRQREAEPVADDLHGNVVDVAPMAGQENDALLPRRCLLRHGPAAAESPRC